MRHLGSTKPLDDGDPTVPEPTLMPLAPGERRARSWDRLAPRRAIGKASRGYSRFVTSMKFALPVLAVAVIGLVAFWPSPDRPVSDAPLPDSVGGSETGQMISPRIAGVDAHNRPYSIVGVSAQQRLSGGERVVFNGPQAEMTLSNGAWLALMANQGEIDRDRSELVLSGAVSLFRDDGYAFVTEEVHVDLERTLAWGNSPVEAYGPAGQVEADGFRLDGERNIIVFLGNSRLVLRDGSDEQLL